MFKWIISLLLILISLPIIYFNMKSFYQAKQEFKANQAKQVYKNNDNNKTAVYNVKNKNKDSYSSFEKEFDKEWKNF
jgi:biopolymer transport protein ExbB/TolQ